jgi:predicted kinase
VARVVLINGAPGSGKSTVARLLADSFPMALALDVDVIKHSIGRWDSDARYAGLQARRLALAMAGVHLRSGHDVFIGQYLARVEFIEQLEDMARETGAGFDEFVLVLDHATLVARLRSRAAQPTRSEHEVNIRLVGRADVPDLLRSMDCLLAQRRSAVSIDASGPPEHTAGLIREGLITGP